MEKKKNSFLEIVKTVLLNKYSFVLFIFLLYLIFFDDHNLIKRYQTKQEIKKLEQEYQYYLDKIHLDKEEIKKLKQDSIYLEKFAREKYYMKKNDEDVFIFK